jgi:flagellar protein FliL
MSSAASTAAPASPAADGAAAPVKGGKKKLIIIAAIVAVLVIGGGAGAFFALKGKPAEAVEGKDGKEGADGKAVKSSDAKKDPKAKPIFVPFESFTVNLADKEYERFGQIIFSIETVDAATGDAIKTHMPAIRGRVLISFSSRTVTELTGREGKEKLAQDILTDARKSLGLADDDKSLIAVHFSHFVMQ